MENFVKQFWEEVKHSGYWSGSIVDISWDDLW